MSNYKTYEACEPNKIKTIILNGKNQKVGFGFGGRNNFYLFDDSTKEWIYAGKIDDIKLSMILWDDLKESNLIHKQETPQ